MHRRREQSMGSRFLRIVGFGVTFVLTATLAAQTSPFGSNDPRARTQSTVSSLHGNMVGRQQAVSAGIVHNTPEIANRVYWNTRLTREARVAQNLLAHGDPPYRDALIMKRWADEVADQARLAAMTQAILSRREPSRQYGSAGSNGSSGAFPGADLIGGVPPVNVPVNYVTAPAAFAGAALPYGGFSDVTVETFVVPSGSYGYGFAPTYGPR